MHIPDGFISTGTAAVTWVASAGAVGYSARRLTHELDERKVPLMGVTAAFIFAAQMMNFAVAGGTSGHLLGAALATILLGPWAASLVLTAVLAVQALLFQDGGLVALGANIFNMAVVGVAVSWVAYYGLRRILGKRTWATFASGFGAAWLSVVCASLMAAGELSLSGTSPASVVFPAMASVHVLIGVGEGLITTAVLAFLRAVRPDLLALRQPSQAGGGQ
jgi:cobalt/nickel transport system permease protein